MVSWIPKNKNELLEGNNYFSQEDENKYVVRALSPLAGSLPRRARTGRPSGRRPKLPKSPRLAPPRSSEHKDDPELGDL